MLIRVTKDTKPLGVPYFRPPEDQTGHSYVDLKEHPEALQNIPEIRGWPELGLTLEQLNRSETPFRTLGCEKAEIDQGGGLFGVSGYVDVCFADLAKAKDEENYDLLFQRFHAHAEKGWPDNDTLVEFEMRSTIFIERDEACWSFAFWLIVRNQGSDIEAKEKWSNALKFFRGFLLKKGVAG